MEAIYPYDRRGMDEALFNLITKATLTGQD